MLELPIPLTFTPTYVPNKLSSFDLKMMESVPHTVLGAKIQVTYTVKVFVKHHGFSELGEGNVTKIPVTILSAECEKQESPKE